MNQRVMIAMAIACNPQLLIADEPTTALDVTIQAQILDLLLSLQRDRGMALILITHNMGVVADTAEPRHRDVCGPDHGGAPTRRAVRGAAASLYALPCWRRCPSAARARAARHHSGRRAGCLTIGRPAASSVRAAPTRPPLAAACDRAAPPGWRSDPLSLSARRSDARRAHRRRRAGVGARSSAR